MAVEAGEAILNGDSHAHTNGHTYGTTNGHGIPQPNKTGIKVIIVGAGFGGLCAAIECHRQGHSVEMYESFKELKVLAV